MNLSQRLSQHFLFFIRPNLVFQKYRSSTLSSRIQKKMIKNEVKTEDLEMTKAVLNARATGRKNFVVSVEGNIASGKTAMLNYFSSLPDCEIIHEPVHKWRDVQGFNPLELMYQNPERWGMALQTYIQLTMLQIHTLPQENPVRLIERSIFSAKYCFVENLFRSGKMPEMEYHILTEWFEWIIATQDVHLDLIVYLRTDPEILQARILKRCRDEEKGIPLDYLKTLHQLYEDWLVHKKFPCPAEVLIINANPPIEKMSESYKEHSHKIVQLYH